MFSNLKWQRIALVMNLFGTALLFYSFQATSSDFKLVTARTKSVLANKEFVQYAMCVNNFTILATDARGELVMGQAGCPEWENARPAAVVNIEHPPFVALGFIVLMAGFLVQYLSVPQSKTIADLRRELKLLKMQDKQS